MAADARDSPGASATTWIVVGSAINGLAAFGFQVIGTRTLGPEAYAPIGVLWTLQYLWIAVAVTALEAYVTRMVTVDGTGTAALRRFLRILRGWLLAAAVVAGAVAWLLRTSLFGGLGDLAAVLSLVVLGYGWYAVVRGRAAGIGRFRAYGLATIGESTLRLAVAIVVLATVASTRSLAWVFPVGPFAVGVWAWARRHPTARDVAAGATERASGPSDQDAFDHDIEVAAGDPACPDSGPLQDGGHDARTTGTARRFLAATSTANAAVQLLLAGGPLVLVPLGADAATISVFFTTITAARVPMTFALNGGLSRLLPPMVQLAEAGDVAGLRRAAVRMLSAIAVTTVIAATTGAAIGPDAMALVFSEAFRPPPALVAVIAAGTVLAVGGLVIDQVYIATRREARLPAVWLAAVALAGALVLTLPGSPSMRVAVAFAAATGVAVTSLSVPLLRR